MNEEITMDSAEFDEVLYRKNLQENDFSAVETEGKGANAE